MMQVGATVAGPMADHLGWRVFFWLNVGILGLSVLILLFLFPETKWHRSHNSQAGSPSKLSPSADNKSASHAKAAMVEDNILSETTSNEAGLNESIVGKGSPSRSQFRFWQPKDQHTTLLNELWMPWRLFAFPIIQFASFVVSWSASLFLTVNLTQAQNFAAPPYNYSSQTIGECLFITTVHSRQVLTIPSFLQCRCVGRSSHRPGHSWPVVRLDLAEIDNKEQRIQRTRNAASDTDTIHCDHDY